MYRKLSDFYLSTDENLTILSELFLIRSWPGYWHDAQSNLRVLLKSVQYYAQKLVCNKFKTSSKLKSSVELVLKQTPQPGFGLRFLYSSPAPSQSQIYRKTFLKSPKSKTFKPVSGLKPVWTQSQNQVWIQFQSSAKLDLKQAQATVQIQFQSRF